MKIPNAALVERAYSLSLARIVSEDSQQNSAMAGSPPKSSKDS